MGGPCEVLADIDNEVCAQSVCDVAAAVAWRIEDKFSRYRKDNIVAAINASARQPVLVDDETAKLLDFAAVLHELSGGLFDITSGVLRRAWSFDGAHHSPDQAEIDALLPLIGWRKVDWQKPKITLLPGMQIDFGGIGKEYAVDHAVQTVSQLYDDAVLVNFGGDLAVTRSRNGDQPWRVGIEDVSGGEGSAKKVIELHAGALATSGDTYRFVQAGGTRLSHILDPRNGRPVQDAPRSVTVAAPTCTQAGMLTTLAMLQGKDAEDFLARQEVRHWVQRA